MKLCVTMSSEEHQNLVGVIRDVHQKLRKALKLSGDHNKVWTEHLKDYDLREQYSVAMFKLATEVWKGKESRIEWTFKTCMDYFYSGGLDRSLDRQRKLRKIFYQKKIQDLNLPGEFVCYFQQNNYENLNRKLKLLDVGSCYNPFSKFEEFNCVGIDLTPATKDVFQCDFLEAEIKPILEKSLFDVNSTSSIFYEKTFDIVVLSLVLEYLPAPQQRAIFCYKSWQLLQENGICIIITPDSKSINHNTQMMKSWKLALEKIGFIRVKYEKLQHVHCMAFRKIKDESIFIDGMEQDSISKLLFIPQDFNNYSKEEHILERTEEESYNICTNFLELPNGDLV